MKINDFLEKKQHGSSAFPIQIYVVDSSHPQYIMPFHWHNELEIIKVSTGILDLFIDNVPYILCDGDVAFVNCRSTHRAEPDNCKYECIVCDISMMIKKSNDVFSSYINPIINGSKRIDPVFHKDDSVLYTAVDSLFTSLKSENDYYELSVISSMFLMFEQLYKRNAVTDGISVKKSSAPAEIVAGLMEWIDSNHSNRITLDALSEKAGVTPNYLCRIFKEHTGKTPIEYINTLRVENICYELLWTDKSITAAAIDNGFDSISYFCRVFKSIKGISAKEYIKKNLRENSQ